MVRGVKLTYFHKAIETKLDDEDANWLIEKIDLRLAYERREKQCWSMMADVRSVKEKDIKFLNAAKKLIKKNKKITSKQLTYIWGICPFDPDIQKALEEDYGQ